MTRQVIDNRYQLVLASQLNYSRCAIGCHCWHRKQEAGRQNIGQEFPVVWQYRNFCTFELDVSRKFSSLSAFLLPSSKTERDNLSRNDCTVPERRNLCTIRTILTSKTKQA